MDKHPSLPPKTDPDSLWKLEHEFYEQYGLTLANWARLEQELSHVFCALCKFEEDDPLGPALFFSGKSFNTRSALLSAATRSSSLDEPAQELLRALIKKARQFESARNKIAHGYPVHAVFPDVRWQGWRIKEGDEADQPGGIGLWEMKSAAGNFAELSMIALMIRRFIKRWHAGVKTLPEECLELIRELPNDALQLPVVPTKEGS